MAISRGATTNSVTTRVLLGIAAASALMVSACGAGPSGGSAPANVAPAAATSAAAQGMSDAQAKDYFLSTVCPVTTSLKLVNNIQIEAGGWKNVDPKQSQRYVQSASDEVRKGADKLSDASVVWPAKLQPSVQGMKDNFLGMIVPLQQMAQATTGAAMEQPWQQVALNPRIAEQQARLDLGLPAANASDDGCPPVPTPSPKPRVTSTPNTSGNANALGGGGNGNGWQSPSGNLRCAYFAEGSAGPSVACIDSDNNRLVILNHGYTRTSDASQSQRNQLPGGSVVDFGESRTLGGGEFICGLTDEGMTCRDMMQGAWFIIRRGYLWTSD